MHGSGTFIAIVGPSGAGKDTLIRAAQRHFGNDPAIVFARRCVTRASGAHEDHDTVSEEEFHRLASEGAFMLWWAANNLHYGLPVALLDRLGEGCTIVANVSRDCVPILRQRTVRMLVIHVTAPPSVLRDRLASRGREGEALVEERILRSLSRDASVEADIRLENDGDVATAIASFVSVLESVRPLSIQYPA